VPDHPPPPAQPQKIPVVGIGASAGGLEALQTFFRSLGGNVGAAYVVIVHLAPDRTSELPAILARETRMRVIQVGDHDKVPLEPDTVYVIAPNRKLELTDTAVGSSRFEQPRGRRAAIDVFFRSLAETHGNIVGIVLSGGGSDGALGAKAIKQAGGVVLAQDPREAAHDSMPRAVIATGTADLVLPVEEIARRLPQLLQHRERLQALISHREAGEAIEGDDESALKRTLELLRRRTGHDFSRYKRSTVLRRLARRMQLSHRPVLADYLRYLEENVEEVQALFQDLLISVTTFFRDPEAWAALQQRVLAELVQDTDSSEPIRCWVPGCATGEEAYTLAILLSEEVERHQLARDFIIFASDVDERALALAREALYPGTIGADVSEERLRRWFRPADGHYRVAPEIRDRVVFAVHSLQRDPPFSRIDLISCRNLLIYLDRELQAQVMQLFRYACRGGGYLFLGSSETANPEHFRPLMKEQRIYQATDSPRRPAIPDLPARVMPLANRSSREQPRAEPAGSGTLHAAALEEHAPPSLLVDDSWQVVHLSQTAGRFLQPAGGPASHSVLQTVRPELRDTVMAALRLAMASPEPQLSAFVPLQLEGTLRRIGILVRRAERPAGSAPHVLLMFLDTGPASEPSRPEAEPEQGTERERQLLRELHEAEQQIERLRTEYHTGAEELRAANEELQSLNEEYRSTTEELETSKEELQSINEELQTVNQELKIKLDEVSRAHNDLENLMVATGIATLFLDRGLCIKRYTPQLAEVFNVKSQDIGRPIRDLTHALVSEQLESDAQRVLAELVPIERGAQTRDGREFILRLRPYRTAEDRIEGVVVTFVDVTQLKQAERVVRENEERFRALIDASAQMVWTTDARGHIVDDSPSWRAYTGQSPEECKGSGWVNAIHQEDRPRAMESWKATVRGGLPLDAEYRVHHAPSGEYRWTSVRAVPLRTAGGQVRGWVGMNIDITERREAERALLALNRSKDEFLAMLGHELRNPLAAIRNSTEVALAAQRKYDAPLPPAQLERLLGIVDRQGRHMTRLVNDLLDVTRITRNKLRLERTPTDLCRSVREIAAAFAPALQSARLELELELPESLSVNADPERLVQMLDNLLRNAITHTDPGGRISVGARRQGP
jgi:two-component system, chemotaxis family, CheB/CheR fusion protein